MSVQKPGFSPPRDRPSKQKGDRLTSKTVGTKLIASAKNRNIAVLLEH